MVSSLKRVSVSEEPVISLEEAKLHLRVDFDDDDSLIEMMISAATDFVDGPGAYLGRAIRDQTWDYYVDEFPSYVAEDPASKYVEIPLPPMKEVVGVFYTDSSGTEQEFSSASYTVDTAHEPGRIILSASGNWPTPIVAPAAVRIRFRAGYVDITESPATMEVPESIRAAMFILLGNMYANRESIVIGTTTAQVSLTVEYLLKRYRFYLGTA